MFRHRHQLRRWATQVLLLWLFGVGSGLANACLVPRLPAHDGGLSTTVSRAATEHHDPMAAGHAHHDGTSQRGHDEPAPDRPGSPAKTNCQDFCDKSGATIPSMKTALDDLQGHAFALVATAVVLPAPAFQPPRPWLPRRDGVRVSSIPIDFLRLAL